MNHNDYLSVEELLADVLFAVNDMEFRKGLPKGWYMSMAQKALQELAFDTFFSRITIDITLNKETLAIELPKGVFNIRELYVFNGEGCCGPSNSQVVHYKRLYNNQGRGDAHTARIKENGASNQSDPFLPTSGNMGRNNSNFSGLKYYANVQNGLLMFSSDCRTYSQVRIVFNGINGDMTTVPIIPRFLEEAVKDFIKVKFYEVMKAREPRKYRILWADAKEDRDNYKNGSWKKARIRVSSMDTWEKESIEEYISSMYHK